MDIQVRVEVKHKFSNFNFQNKNENISINHEKYRFGNLGDKFIEFNEYEEVEIKFISSNKEDFLEIDSYDSEEPIKLYPQQSKIISPGGDKDNMLIPGYYYVKVKASSNIYEGRYFVKPSSYEYNEMLNIRDYLNKIVNGLAYDIYLERKGYGECREAGILSNFEKYKYLQQEFENLISSIDYVISNPITDIKKVYRIKSYSKKIDSKSQRWFNSKGQIYNNIYVPNKFYEKHSYDTNNIKENIILKNILENIFFLIVKIQREYGMLLVKFSKKIEQKNKRCSDIRSSYNKIKDNWNYKSRSKQLNRNLDILSNEIKKDEENKKNIERNISLINKMKSKLSLYVNESWISAIDNKYNYCEIATIKLLRNKYYNTIYFIYRNLFSSNVEGNFNIKFPYKKSSKLFEIYIYILVKNVLEDIGFTWTEGWLKSKEEFYYIDGNLNSGDYIILTQGEYKIILEYDRVISRPNDMNDNANSQIVSNVNHNRPDILLSFFKEDNFVGSIVIEVKYRKRKYIYKNKSEDTDVMEQLKAYRLFEYYDEMIQRISLQINKPIKKVIAVYPKGDNDELYEEDMYGILFIPIKPQNNEKEPLGYLDLKSEIKNVINEMISKDIYVS